MRTHPALASILLPLARSVAAFAGSSSGCLCIYGQSCWPSDSEFAQLQSQVSQPLIHPIPTASACYPVSHPSGNCSAVIENWTNGNWRSSMPGSMESPNFETFVFLNGTINACYCNTSIMGTCGQGSVPAIRVDARSVQDIQAAVAFAVQHNLRLVVKNTGHDFLGRSAARGSFMVWTHDMKNITYNATWIPQGAPPSEQFDAITLGAGIQWHEAYATANDHKRVMVGGFSSGGSVGAAGGWLAGGSHSALSPTYGLGVDNTLEISVVLSTGEFLVTNNHQNLDLFWALRGGGGSTYGIVTSITYRTYPSIPSQLYIFQANITNSSAASELVGGLLRYQIQFTDDGWGGYGSISNQSVGFFYFRPNMTNETVAVTTQGWNDYAASLAPFGVSSQNRTYYSPSFYVLYESIYSDNKQDGNNTLFMGRLLSRDTVANKYAQIAELLLSCNASLNTIAGGKVSTFAADSAGINPAWQNAVAETTCMFTWEDGVSSTEINGLISQLKVLIKNMHDLTLDDGAYFNEASLYEIDWQQTFFGSHYAMHKSIKDKYDPYRLFVVAEGVGSEERNGDLTCQQ